jgi:hypothetical protein
VLHYEQDQQPRQRRRTQYSADLSTGKWAVVAPASGGPALAVIGTDQDNEIEAWDMDSDGVHLQSGAGLSLEAEESRTTLTWLALADEGIRAAREYQVLERVTELP